MSNVRSHWNLRAMRLRTSTFTELLSVHFDPPWPAPMNLLRKAPVPALAVSLLSPGDAWARGGSAHGAGVLVALAVLFGIYFIVKLINQSFPDLFPAVGGLFILFALAIGAAEALNVLGVIESSTVPWLGIVLLVAILLNFMRSSGASTNAGPLNGVRKPASLTRLSEPQEQQSSARTESPHSPLPSPPSHTARTSSPPQSSNHPERYCGICRTIVLPRRRLFVKRQCPRCGFTF
jgi:hypothetical protein